MPLEPKFADIPLQIGIDEDTDEAGNPEGLLALVNCEYTKEGVVRGRHGFTRDVNLPAGIKVRGLIQAGNSLGVVTTDKILPVSPDTGKVGAAQPTGIGHTEPLFLGSTGQNVVSVDSHRKVVSGTDYTFVGMLVQDQFDPAAETAIKRPNTDNPTTFAMFQIRESLTGAVVREGQLSFVPSEYCLRVVPWTTGWIVFVATEFDPGTSEAKLKAYRVPGVTGAITEEIISPSTVLDWETALTLPGCPYDAVFSNHPDTVGGPAVDKIYIAMWVNDGNGHEQRLFRYTPGSGTSGGLSATPTVPMKTTQTCTQALCVAQYGTTYYAVGAMYRAGTNTTTLIYYRLTGAPATGSINLPQTEDNLFGNNGPTLATMTQFAPSAPITLLYATDTNYTVAAQVSLATGAFTGLITRKWPGMHPTTRMATRPLLMDGVNPGTFVGVRNSHTDETLYRNSHLVSVLGNNGVILDHPIPIGTLLHSEEIWPSVDFAADSGVPVAAFGNFMPGELILPSMTPFGEGFTVTLPADLDATMDGNKRSRRYRTLDVVLDPLLRRPVVYAQIAGSAMVSGSMPTLWDGSEASQGAWLYGPPPPTVRLWETPTVPMPEGTYRYVQVLEHIDHNGKIVRSPPSPAVTVNVGPDDDQARFMPQLYEPFLDRGQSQGYRIKLYRTAADGLPDYRLVLDMAVYLDITYDWWYDEVPDAERGAELYTQDLAGQELAAQPVPPFEHVVIHRNRVVGVRSDAHQIWFSKEVTDPALPEWHEVMSIKVDNDAGAPTALASLSDLLVVFQEHAVCIVDGQGPDSAGNPPNAFTIPQKVITGYGVAKLDNASVVTTPIGVLFKHSTGIKLLTKPTEAVDVGDAVRDQVKLMGHISGVYLPGRRQAWFFGDGDEGGGVTNSSAFNILVLDIDRVRWSVWTPNLAGLQPRGATELDGVAYVATDAAVWKLDETEWADRWSGNRYGYTETLDIPWFRGAGQAGMQRVWDVAISGYKPGGSPPPNVKVEVYTHQAHRPEKTALVPDATYTFPIQRLPDGMGWFILTFRPRVQRCIAMRLRITIQNPDNYEYEPIRISNIRYHFGVVNPQGRAPTFPVIT